METGGLFGTSKYKQLKFLPDNLKPITIIVPPDESIPRLTERINFNKINYPCIAKPDKAERGSGVELLQNFNDLKNYLNKATSDFLIQEYISFPFEAGVFYYRFPNGKPGKIPSIVLKEFLNVVGDGKSSIKELMMKNFRAKLVWERQSKKTGFDPDFIPESNEKLLLEPIGNHNRGTAFLNGNHLINEQLESIFTKISNNLPDFYYGRFDLKAPSLEAFCRGEGIKILEVNGVNAEPAHIYDPTTPLLIGLQTLLKHWRIIYQISRINRISGIKPEKFLQVLSHYKEWKKAR